MRVVIQIRWDTKFSGPRAEALEEKRCLVEWQRYRWEILQDTFRSIHAQDTRHEVEAWLLADEKNQSIHQEAQGPGSRLLPLIPWLWVYGWGAARQFHVMDEPTFFMRLDSDDLIAPYVVERMVHEAQKDTSRFVQLHNRGFAYDREAQKFYHWDNPSPPFFGRIETSATIDTPWPPHGEVCRGSARVDVWPPYCVQLHGDNVCNQLDSRWCRAACDREDSVELSALFGLPLAGDTTDWEDRQ